MPTRPVPTHFSTVLGTQVQFGLSEFQPITQDYLKFSPKIHLAQFLPEI